MLAGMAAPLILNGISVVAGVWFSDKQRNIATSLAGLAAPLGNMTSLIIVGIVFAGYALSVDLKENGADLRHRIKLLLLIQNCIDSVFDIGLFIFIKEKPDVAPSRSATEKPPDVNFLKEVKDLLSQKDYVLIMTIFTFCFGIYTTSGAILGPIFEPYGYDSTEISIFGAFHILFGLIGCVVTGIVLDKTKRFLRTLRLVCLGSLMCYCWSLYAIPSGNAKLMLAS